jgi:hypothetical protein
MCVPRNPPADFASAGSFKSFAGPFAVLSMDVLCVDTAAPLLQRDSRTKPTVAGSGTAAICAAALSETQQPFHTCFQRMHCYGTVQMDGGSCRLSITVHRRFLNE